VGLSFLVPAFLLGLLALAAPVIAHLRQRERRQPVRFPSLMFLSRVAHRTTERRRLTHRLLLLLRALAVTALVLAFARPFLARDPAAAAAGRARAVVVLLDRSMSMAYDGVWTRALDSARAALAGLGPGDRAALVAFDEAAAVVAPLTGDLAAVTARLAGLAPGSGGTRLAPAFRAAREVLAGAPEARPELVVISDLQRHALAGLETADPVPGATVRVAPVGPADPANARVVSVTVDRTAAGRQAELRVAARVAVRGSSPRAGRATLEVNGREVATATGPLPAEGLATLTFPMVRVPDGAVAASVRLAPDALAADDDHRFALGGPAGLRVLLAVPPETGADQLVYLERALALSRSPALLVEVRRGAIAAADLERATVVVAADLAPLAARPGAVAAFLARGGGLVAFAGPRPGRLERADWLPARVGAVVDRTRERGATLGWVQVDHPVFEPFREAAGDFGAARFFRLRALEPDSGATVLARFDDGAPALVEARHGPGRVVLVATAADALWSDLPLQPVFLPLLHRLVSHVARVGDDRRSWETGGVATLPATAGELVVEQPGGEVLRLPADTGTRTLALAEAGFYRVREAGAGAGPVAVLAVNPPAAESDLALARADELAALLRPGDTTATAEAVPVTAAEQEARQNWWLWLVAAAVALLTAEAWYAGRLGGRAAPKGGLA
jgi:hypothetical protein